MVSSRALYRSTLGGMRSEHTARCACGQLRVTVRGELPPTSICHCRQCQRRTGSAFGVQVKVPEERVAFEGEASTWERRAEGLVTTRFCPRCGTTVWWTIDDMEGVIIIAGGTFAGAPLPAPTFSVYEERMHPWVRLPDTIETHWD